MKIKNIFIKLLAMVTLAWGLGACSDEFFEVPNGERITSDEHYQDIQDATTSLYGTLIYLQDIVPRAILVDGLRSDQMILNPNSDLDLQDLIDLNIHGSNPFIEHSDFYKVIINVNETLANIDSAEVRDRDFTGGQLFDMKSTLYGLRAWCYLNLARNYNEVTWIEGNMTGLPASDDDLLVLDKAAIIDTLINQFRRDSVIYEDANMAHSENVYFNFPSPKVVLGELYLERDDYEEAIKYLKLALETVDEDDIPAELRDYVYKVAIYRELGWKSIFQNGASNLAESMGAIPFNQTQKQENPLIQFILPEDQFAVIPAQHLIDSMEMAIQSNLRDTADIYRGMGITYDTLFTGDDYYIKKYDLEARPYSTDIILQRAADVHLLLAEALNRSGRSDVALMLLNSGIAAESSKPDGFDDFGDNLGVRGRVLLAPRVIADSLLEEPENLDIAIIEQIEDWIIEEKAMECAFEGKRMSDLIRVAERRDNPGEYIGSRVARKYTDPAMQQKAKDFYMNSANWYLPQPK